VLLVGHGTRDLDAHREMAQFARLRQDVVPETRLEVCSLSMSRPGLEEALAMAASWPQRRVVIQPHLLFPGALFDRMTCAVDGVRRQCPGKLWLIAQPLGPDRLLADAVVTLLKSPVDGNGPVNEALGGRSPDVDHRGVGISPTK
jgi:sirohydrochlorin ferrochelatase